MSTSKTSKRDRTSGSNDRTIDKELAWSTPIDLLSRTVEIDGNKSPVENYIKNLKQRGDYEIEEKDGKVWVYFKQ